MFHSCTHGLAWNENPIQVKKHTLTFNSQRHGEDIKMLKEPASIRITKGFEPKCTEFNFEMIVHLMTPSNIIKTINNFLRNCVAFENCKSCSRWCIRWNSNHFQIDINVNWISQIQCSKGFGSCKPQWEPYTITANAFTSEKNYKSNDSLRTREWCRTISWCSWWSHNNCFSEILLWRLREVLWVV